MFPFSFLCFPSVRLAGYCQDTTEELLERTKIDDVVSGYAYRSKGKQLTTQATN